MMKETAHRLGFNILDGVIALGITVACFSRDGCSLNTLTGIPSQRISVADAIVGLCFVGSWCFCFSVLKLYDKFATIQSRIGATLKGISIMMFPILAYCTILHSHIVTIRSVTLTFGALLCYEINRLAFSVHLLDQVGARDPRRVIIIGSGRRACKAWNAVRNRYRFSLSLIGFIDDRDINEMPPDIARRYLGSLSELRHTILREVVDVILIAMPMKSCYPLMQEAVHVAESAGIPVFYLNDIYATRKASSDPNQAMFRELAFDQEQYLLFLAAKRLIDIVGAIVGIIILSPVLLAIAGAVKLTSRGPALFRQKRFGYRRRRFTMLKFRSMVDNAEQLMADLEDENEAVGPIFKMRNDPRVTKLGKLLRRTSLDELPQLWNVLVGDMSLVGPRPMSIRDVSLFDEAALMRRFSVWPGMTGLWQVSGRSESGFDQWIILDNRYVDGLSLALDLKILARTISVVIRRSGAM